MCQPLWTLGAGLILALCACGVAPADHSSVAPRPGFLVLRSGRVLRGDVIRVGDRYVVGLGERDEVRVSVRDVEFQCDSLEEAYRRKCHALTLDARQGAAQHLDLADWCLRYGLYEAAAEQLAMAEQWEPGAPACERFAKRLELATQPVAGPPPATLAPGPANRGAVSEGATPADLDRFMQQMPRGTVESFTNFVQPLLINRCGAGGCHGANSPSSFVLMNPHWSRVVPRRFTQQNLHATMRQVNRDQPQASPLLVMARRGHGGTPPPLSPDREVALLEQLSEWVHHSAERGGATDTSQARGASSSRVVPTGHSRPTPPSAGVPLAGPPDPSGPLSGARSQPDQPQAGAAVSAGEQSPDRPTDVGPSHAGSSADPFDPQIFNRRFVRRVP